MLIFLPGYATIHLVDTNHQALCLSFRAAVVAAAMVGAPVPGFCQLDQNSNQQSDIWEVWFGASGLNPLADSDHDGFSNAAESTAGTNPFNPASRPLIELLFGGGGQVDACWPSEPGKVYDIEGSQTLAPGSWLSLAEVYGDGSMLQQPLSTGGQPRWFFRLNADDTDSDGDQLTDWEEYRLGFDPKNNHSDRNSTVDQQRVGNSWNAPNTITVGLIDGDLREDWPDPGVIAIRRSGGIQPVTVSLSITGSAAIGLDFTTPAATQIVIPLGSREAWVELSPVNDSDVEGPETIIVTVNPLPGYTVGAANSATVTINDASALPSAKAAARFLLQSAFGPDQDSTGDADIIPENVEEVMASGFEPWINDQFNRPLGYLQPFVDWAAVNANALQLFGNHKEFSWWHRVMGVPKLRPDAANDQLPDPLRQRMAFALSEILVTSDRPEALGPEQRGMANYYDLFIQHAFGNYRDLLYAVATHPVMGVYLSHLNNQKANPALKIYPDENFAREIMQLFTIGLWELEQNGMRKTYPAGHPQAGEPIPSYNNNDITELARVFTGLTFADKNFPGTNGDYKQPMKMWDAFHDCDPKTLLGGFAIPARTPSPGNTGAAGLADVDDAVGSLFNHPNTAPFISRLLIQRFVTSNPSHDYIGRVAAKFANNGFGVRGDLKAVLKQILLDPEARDPAMMGLPHWGKLREPFLRVVNLARAFNAASVSGYYPLDQFNLDHMQDPMNAPSVFNFFLPGHSPPGPITEQGYVAPEFQIINASSAITGPNYFWNAIGGNNLHRWGSGNSNYAVKLTTDPELSMVVPAGSISEDVPSESGLMDTDPLLRRLDMALTGGTMSPRQFQIIRESIDRVKPSTGWSWKWHRERLRLAIYLIVTSAEFNVLR